MSKQDRLNYEGLSSTYIYEKMCAKLCNSKNEEPIAAKEAQEFYSYRLYSSLEAQKEVEQAGCVWKIIAKVAFAGKNWIKKIPVIGPFAISVKESFLHRSGIQKDVSNLLVLDINEFIRESYRVFLGREADEEGFQSYQALLCTGMPREALFYIFSNSDEFKNRFIVLNLREYRKKYSRFQFKNKLKHIPVISHIVYMVQLPKRMQRMELEYGKFLADLRELTLHQQSRIDSLHKGIWELQNNYQQIEDLLFKQEQNYQKLLCMVEEHKNMFDNVEQKFLSVNQALAELGKIDALQAERLDKMEIAMPIVQQTIKTMEAGIKELSETAMRYVHEELPNVYINNGILGHPSYLEHIGISQNNCTVSMDAFYEYLGKLFRGNVEAMERHMETYIPYIEKAVTRTKQRLFLDVGCGKGAFVAQLQSHGITAKGVDINEESVKEGIVLGRDIQLYDGLEYMKTLENGSLSGVSMFQVAEHMSFDLLFEMTEEISRVVAKDGIVLIETINSWCYRHLGNYHIDPSHIVIPSSDSIKLMLEMLGFRDVKIMFYAPIGKHAIEGEMIETNYEGFCVIGRKAGHIE